MKILFIDFKLPYLLTDSSYPIGGWTVQLRAWITGLRFIDNEVGVLTWKGANSFVDKELNFDLIETYDPDKGIKIFKYFYYYIPSLYKTVAQYKPDVTVQACSGLNTGIMAYIGKRLDIPFIYRATSDRDADGRYKNGLLKYEQVAYNYGLKRADAILCQNSYQYEHLKEQFPEKALHILHNPFLKASNIPISSYEDRKYIAWLGVFKREKNLALLYDVAKKCCEVTFKIAGMPANSVHNCTKEALKNLKSLSNVKFVGYLSREKVIPFLSNALALINTSYYEGFSNTFLEAFTAGTPVIAPCHVDPDNIITTNQLGFTAEKDDELAGVIEQIFELDEKEYFALSKRCRAFVEERHDPIKKAQELTRILLSVLKDVNSV